ncbi:GtrA family protein [Mesorhizobium sp. WSM2239]|uniref:GtrA family protein n=2 Tax=unclassified Mesorhizobium TaxID=325217 RepID=A0AAU8D9V8_9HYPH
MAIFVSVGVAATILYFVLASSTSVILQVSPSISSVVAYLLSAVFSYCGHKYLSFTSSGAHTIEAPRFVVTTTLGLLIAYLLPLAAERMGLPHFVAYAAVCLVVPMVNFVLLKRWVFRIGNSPHEAVFAGGSTGRLLAWGLVISCVAFVIQLTMWPINPDTSWLITVIERMRAGDRLYVDVIELNPPSSIWLYWVPVLLSRPIGLLPESVVYAYTLLICLGGVAMTGWIIRSGNLITGRALAQAMALMLVSAALLVGNSFSERDHIGAVLLTPLIALTAWRGSGSAGLAPRHWLAAGFAGGVIALVKPYYAVVVFAAATYVVVRRRDIGLFLLPEFLIAGGMSVAYMAVFYLAYPIYFEELLPILRETYMAFSWPLDLLAVLAAPLLVIPVVYGIFARSGGRSIFGDLLLICAGAACIPYFTQGKGWAYHTYPAVYLGSVAVIVAACKLVFDRPGPAVRLPKLAEIAGLTLMALVAAHWRFFPDHAASRDLATAVRGQTSSPTVGMLGGDIAAGHPLARMLGGRWIEPYCSDWIAIFALRLEDEALRQGDGERAGYFKDMLNRYLAGKRERLTEAPPEILIVDRGDRLVRMMLAEHGFDRLLANYAMTGADKELEVYRLANPTVVEPHDMAVQDGIVTLLRVRLMRPPFFKSVEVAG